MAPARQAKDAAGRAAELASLRVVLDDRTLADLPAARPFWTQAQYLALTQHCNRLLEFTDGRIEPLPMPTDTHQAIVGYLYLALNGHLRSLGGKVAFAPLRLLIRPGKFREPDLLALLDAADARRQDDYWRGADLVMEVASPDNPRRDLVDKRRDYAEAGIPEYWIVEPAERTVTVLQLALEYGRYEEAGVFRPGEQAISVQLPQFAVDVEAMFATD